MMYNLQDSSQPWMAIVFCILLVIVGSWFLLNVILAVIMQAFEDVDKNQKTEDERKDNELKDLKLLYGVEESEDSLSSVESKSNDSDSEGNKDASPAPDIIALQNPIVAN